MDPLKKDKGSSLKWETQKGSTDCNGSKDTSKLLPSEDIKEKYHDASSPLSYSRPSDSIVQLHLNVKVLYGLFAGLATIFVCSGIICAMHLRSLRRDLDLINDVIYHMHNDALNFKETDQFADFLKKVRVLDQNTSETDKAKFWAAASDEVDKINQEAKSDSHINTGRREKRHANDGAPEDWAWMSSYSRVPMSAMGAYCQEIKTYCNAKGPRGPPGEKGNKGDKGTDGSRTYNGRVLKGPKGDQGVPGPQGPDGKTGSPGQRGEDGMTGPRGPQGSKGYHGNIGFPGVSGPPGSKGDKGSQGLIGPPGPMGQKGGRGHTGSKGRKGDRATDGLPGMPGLKGHRGDRGVPGPVGMRGPHGDKGEPGVCETFQCVDMERPTEATTTTTAPTLPPIKKVCSVKIIGTPLQLSQRKPSQGAFMLDAAATRGARDLGKVWATFGTEGNTIWEYPDMHHFNEDKSGKAKNLSSSPFFGTGHKVHDEIFYYHWKGQPKIVRFDLIRGEPTAVRALPDLIDTSSTGKNEKAFLYSSKTSVVDFHLDRNGLWALYIKNSTNKVVAVLLDKTTLDVKVTVPLNDLEPRSRGGAFIVCGKLYTIRHHNRLHSHLDGIFDLWQNGTLQKVHLKINIPYRQNAMLSYNYRVKQILGWDSDKQMDYPLILV